MTENLTVEAFGDLRHWSHEQLRKLADENRVRVADVITDHPTATHVTFESRPGDYRASVPFDVARRQGLLLLQDDESIRLRVEDGATLCWNVKDVARLRLTVGPEPDSVPENPTH